MTAKTYIQFKQGKIIKHTGQKLQKDLTTTKGHKMTTKSTTERGKIHIKCVCVKRSHCAVIMFNVNTGTKTTR